MRKYLLRRFLTGLLIIALSVAILWSGSILILASEGTKHITILCTNDTLGAFLPCG